MKQFRPMKGEPAVLDKLQFPYFATPKMDGHRVLVRGGLALTSALKPVANRYIRECLERPEYEGFDGEVTVGPHDANVYRRTTSAIRREDGEPNFCFHVFDLHDLEGTAEERYVALMDRDWAHLPHARMIVSKVLIDRDALDRAMEHALGAGFEGLMLRSPSSPYKHGKATVKENWLLKYKPYEDFEAEVLGVIEAMENQNEKKVNERGLAERSGHKANKVPKGEMGALQCRALNGRYEGVEFEVGTGFTAAHRKRKDWAGSTIVIRCDIAGGYDKPRFPSYKGDRIAQDMPA